MASIRESIGQIRAQWSELAMGKKISFLLIFSVMVAGFTVLVMWAGTPQYKLLYQDLTVEDANGITTHLEESRIQYKITRGGTAISVPDQDFYEARMSLANAGLPTGGAVGFELFDRKGLGLTEAQMKIARLRSLQGELARTIKQLDPVESVRVHLAMPAQSLFIEDKKETTASVVIKLAANAKLSGDQVEGVVFLVSSSVEGLAPGNVTVIDQRGKVLSQRRDDSAGGVGDMEDRARKLERQFEHRIETLLARSVGPEKVASRVNATLERQQVSKVEELYDPESAVIRSQQRTETDSNSSETSSSAFPGAEANLPEDNFTEGSKNATKSNKIQETVNYEINRTTATTTQPGGGLTKISVAVLIDGTYKETEGEEGKTVREYVPRTPEEMAIYTDIVKKIVGFNEKRGDQIEVANIPFVAEDAGVMAAPASDLDFFIRIGQYVFIVLGALLFLFFVVRPLVRWVTTEPSLERQLGMSAHMLEGSTVGELETRMAAGQLGAAPAAADASEAEGLPAGESLADRMSHLNQQKADLLETASRDRDAVTLMVRRWLKEWDSNV
jgi:flagellar M-ring protein FliF